MIYSRESIESLRLKREKVLEILVVSYTEQDRSELVEELRLLNEELDRRFDGISEELWTEVESDFILCDNSTYLKYLQGRQKNGQT